MPERAYAEYRLDENVILVLDHRVVEIFDATHKSVSGSPRWHVDHIGVEAKPRRNGLRITIGARLPDDSMSYIGAQAVLDVPEDKVPEVLAFFDRAKAARTGRS
ncbi:hypothetical protein [Rhodococcoides yunnanense]|uniref:hypothetical protein n=1 Tax=Rhodococcoides yunnanense TaxID=278209 RepID=UPI00093501FC|nr:hypothetical protein [Rhodococcus yunnanensis]